MQTLCFTLALLAGQAAEPKAPTPEEVERDFLASPWHAADPDAGGYVLITLEKKTHFFKAPTCRVLIQTMAATKGKGGKWRYGDYHGWRGTYELRKSTVAGRNACLHCTLQEHFIMNAQGVIVPDAGWQAATVGLDLRKWAGDREHHDLYQFTLTSTDLARLGWIREGKGALVERKPKN